MPRADFRPVTAAPLLVGPLKPTQEVAIVVSARLTSPVDLKVSEVVVRRHSGGRAVKAHSWELFHLTGLVEHDGEPQRLYPDPSQPPIAVPQLINGGWSQRYYQPPPYQPPLLPGVHTLIVKAIVDDLGWRAFHEGRLSRLARSLARWIRLDSGVASWGWCEITLSLDSGEERVIGQPFTPCPHPTA